MFTSRKHRTPPLYSRVKWHTLSLSYLWRIQLQSLVLCPVYRLVTQDWSVIWFTPVSFLFSSPVHVPKRLPSLDSQVLPLEPPNSSTSFALEKSLSYFLKPVRLNPCNSFVTFFNLPKLSSWISLQPHYIPLSSSPFPFSGLCYSGAICIWTHMKVIVEWRRPSYPGWFNTSWALLISSGTLSRLFIMTAAHLTSREEHFSSHLKSRKLLRTNSYIFLIRLKPTALLFVIYITLSWCMIQTAKNHLVKLCKGHK